MNEDPTFSQSDFKDMGIEYKIPYSMRNDHPKWHAYGWALLNIIGSFIAIYAISKLK